jgi:type IV pilus assembly protein PilM
MFPEGIPPSGHGGGCAIPRKEHRMLARTKSVVGLDIGSSAIKAVELAQRGKDTAVTAFGQVEVPPDDRDARTRAIRELLDAGGFHPRRMVSSLSGKNVIVRYLTMVRMGDDELRNAIVFEAEKYVPWPLDECIIDCQRLEEKDDSRRGGNMMVLMVAVRRSQVDDHLQILDGAGQQPEAIDVDAFALGNAHALCRAQSSELEEDGVTAFVDVGAAKTNVNILDRGTSLFTREIGMGGNDFTQAVAKKLNISVDDAEDKKRAGGDDVRDAIFPVIDDLGNEIQLSFDYFENQFQKEIGRILLSGGGARLGFFASAFERIFEKPTAVFNPFAYLKIDDGIDADLLACNAAQLVTAVGLAARLQKA